MLDRMSKLALIERSLGIRHKLKVHESMRPAENHEEMAISLLAKWELEDELRAIEEILAEQRVKNVGVKRNIAIKQWTKSMEPAPSDDGNEDVTASTQAEIKKVDPEKDPRPSARRRREKEK